MDRDLGSFPGGISELQMAVPGKEILQTFQMFCSAEMCFCWNPSGHLLERHRVRSLFFPELILVFNPGLEAFRRKSLCSSLMEIAWIKWLMDSKWWHSLGTS